MPLPYFTHLGQINFLTKIDCKVKLYFEKDMKTLFESRKVLASGSALLTPDVKIIFTKAPYIQYSVQTNFIR